MTEENVIQVGASDFVKEVEKSQIPVLVDFGAPRCGPCRMLEPTLFELAKEYQGRVKFCQVNADQNPALAAKFQIFSIPAVFMLKKGKVKGQRVGLCSKEELKKMIDVALDG